MVQGIAIRDRVNVEHLSNKERMTSILNVPTSTWLLSDIQYKRIQDVLKILVKRAICYHINHFKCHYSAFAEDHIHHQYHKEMIVKSNVVSNS